MIQILWERSEREREKERQESTKARAQERERESTGKRPSLSRSMQAYLYPWRAHSTSCTAILEVLAAATCSGRRPAESSCLTPPGSRFKSSASRLSECCSTWSCLYKFLQLPPQPSEGICTKSLRVDGFMLGYVSIRMQSHTHQQKAHAQTHTTHTSIHNTS